MPEVTPVPLAQLTTLRTGGIPARMIDAATPEELVHVLRSVWADGDPWLVLGGGSNLFVGDEPFEGTVVRVRTEGIERMPSPRPGFVRLRVQAGHDWDALVSFAVGEGLAVILSVTLELAEVGHAERPIVGEQLRTALGLRPGDAVSVSWIRDHVIATR